MLRVEVAIGEKGWPGLPHQAVSVDRLVQKQISALLLKKELVAHGPLAQKALFINKLPCWRARTELLGFGGRQHFFDLLRADGAGHP